MKKLWRKADRQTVKVHNKTKSIERKGKRCKGKKKVTSDKTKLVSGKQIGTIGSESESQTVRKSA